MPNSIYLFEVLYNVVYGLPQSKGAGFCTTARVYLEGSWDLVTGVITKVTILISTYNPN